MDTSQDYRLPVVMNPAEKALLDSLKTSTGLSGKGVVIRALKALQAVDGAALVTVTGVDGKRVKLKLV